MSLGYHSIITKGLTGADAACSSGMITVGFGLSVSVSTPPVSPSPLVGGGGSIGHTGIRSASPSNPIMVPLSHENTIFVADNTKHVKIDITIFGKHTSVEYKVATDNMFLAFIDYIRINKPKVRFSNLNILTARDKIKVLIHNFTMKDL